MVYTLVSLEDAAGDTVEHTVVGCDVKIVDGDTAVHSLEGNVVHTVEDTVVDTLDGAAGCSGSDVTDRTQRKDVLFLGTLAVVPFVQKLLVVSCRSSPWLSLSWEEWWILLHLPDVRFPSKCKAL